MNNANNNLFKRGSEWRRWDFHIHTPYSVLNSAFENNWDEYVKILFKTAIDNKISAIAITDYYAIDGYKKIINDYINKPDKLEILFDEQEIEKIKDIYLFPNIEFRMNKLVIGNETDLSWNEKINCHVLFPKDKELSTVDIEENFISNLHFEYSGTIGLSSQNKSLTKRNIENLGQRLKEEHQNFRGYSDLYVGMMNISVDDKEIKDILESQSDLFAGKYLFGVPADENLSDVNWNSQGHQPRKLIIQKSHFIFSSNAGTIEFCLGLKHRTKEEFIDEFKTLKPCLWGTEGHEIERLFKPDQNRYTWIKSDLTFEGLKQVIFEPEERVKIQENIPEDKTPYLVINRVKYIDESDKHNFQPEWILLNENLNAIIGGKSSGKSLLLHHIAQTIDKEQVEEKSVIVSANDYKDFRSENPFDFSVVWKNGGNCKLSDEEREESYQITYIPQSYINRLAEEKGERHLYDLVNSILLQNEEFANYHTTKMQEIIAAKSIIWQQIDSIITLREELAKINKEIKDIGTKEKINAEIKRLNKSIGILRKESGFTEEENKEYEYLIKNYRHNEKKAIRYHKLSDQLQSFYEFAEQEMVNLSEKFTNHSSIILDSFDKKIINSLSEKFIENLISTHKSSMDNIKLLLDKVNSKIGKISIIEKRIKEELKPYMVKIKNQKLLKKLDEDLKKEKEKLLKLDAKINHAKVIIEKGKNTNKKILDYYETMFKLYLDIENELQLDNYKKICEDLDLESNLVFNNVKFGKFTGLFDGRIKLTNDFYGVFNDDNEYLFRKDRHVDDIRSIFDKLRDITKLKIRLREGVQLKDIYKNLFDDYFDYNYILKKDGEDILSMSPGKRGIVLLQLILHISNATFPILIDQPEDNLDNRTIYEELKSFIRAKKCIRQIIIVTHNANLVVSTDTENIIVANQSGQQVGKDKREYNFEYVTGALENTFVDESKSGILYKYGVKEHVCDILEGGRKAFEERERKYGFIKF